MTTVTISRELAEELEHFLLLNINSPLDAILAFTLRKVMDEQHAQPEPAGELPPLPKPTQWLGEQLWAYSADNMKDYARAAIAQSKNEPQWQPIETAPKGRIVLVHYKNSLGNGRTMRASYYLSETLDSDSTESGWADEGWYEESEAYEYLMPLDCAPTHWMPLPAAPQAAQPQVSEPQRYLCRKDHSDGKYPCPDCVRMPQAGDHIEQHLGMVDCRQCKEYITGDATVHCVASHHFAKNPCINGDKFVKLPAVQLYRRGV